MARTVLVLFAMASAPAWAVGERISLPQGAPFTEQLHETLCISMECGTGTDASITAKVVKGNKAEVKVFSPTGALKATVTAPLNAAGKISSMDLVAATSGIIQAIEAPEPSKASADKSGKKLLAAKTKKKASLKLASKARGLHHSRG